MANVRVIEGMLSGGGQAYLHTAGPGDVSEGFLGYDPDCGWCWLGAPHSVEAHDTRTREG